MFKFGKKNEEDPVVTKRLERRDGAPLFLVEPHAHAALVTGSIAKLVVLPEYLDVNEWLAANAHDFFHHVNMLYGTVAGFCTPRDCPIMSAGEGVEYLWTNNDQKAVRIPAPQYIDYVMTWIQSQLIDEAVFPSRAGTEFPKNFAEVVKVVFKRLFRVLAHMYHSHYDKIVIMNEDPHLNTVFAHFVAFALQFKLLDDKDLAPMRDLIAELTRVGSIATGPDRQPPLVAGSVDDDAY